MAERRIGLIMHGVTGRMGMNQHLIRSIVAIRKEGGVPLRNGDRLMPDPIIIGRNREKLEALAKKYGLERVGTDLKVALAAPAGRSLFRCRYHANARFAAAQGHRGRQGCLLREADRRQL